MRLALAAISLLVVSIYGAHGASPAPSELIVFESSRNGASELFTVHSDGSGLRRITRSFPPADALAWSPDGRRIAFARYSPTVGGVAIWTSRSDGTALRRLTRTPEKRCDSYPAWSPDGRRILFHRDACGFGANELWVVDVDGTGKHPVLALPPRVTGGDTITGLEWRRGNVLVDGNGSCKLLMRPDGSRRRFVLCGRGARSAVFSHDGRGIAFLARGRAATVAYTASLAGRDERRIAALPHSAHSLAASGAGVFAVVVGGRPPGIHTFDSGAKMRLLVRRTSEDEVLSSPAWSPDGRMLAYVRDGGIRVVRADGADDRALAPFGPAHSPSWASNGRGIVYSRSIGRDHAMIVGVTGRNPRVLLTRPNGVREPRIAPGGDAIAYVYDGGREGFPCVAIRRLPRGPTRTVASYAESPEWSPDGRRIVYVHLDAETGENRSIWTVRADGGGRTRLTSETDAAGSPVWSPDGRRIVYEEALKVWVMDADGANKRVLVEDGYTPAWSRDGREVVFARDSRLVAVAVATGAERTIVAEGGVNPRWQPAPR